MKRILSILIGIAFLQTQANICFGNASEIYKQACTAEWNANGLHAWKEATDEEKTEWMFYNFVTEDVAAHEKTKKDRDTYYYAAFLNANRAYNAILNLFVFRTKQEKLDFARTKKYETEWMAVEWQENSVGKAAVMGGFARIDVIFKKRKENYTVVFCRK